MMHRMSGKNTARGKDNDQQNLWKKMMWYHSVYNQIASDVWSHNNPIYVLIMEKLQLMLINVLIKYLKLKFHRVT